MKNYKKLENLQGNVFSKKLKFGVMGGAGLYSVIASNGQTTVSQLGAKDPQIDSLVLGVPTKKEDK